MEKIVISTIADCLINLGAGWFGVAIILPGNTKKSKLSRKLLTSNIMFGISSLALAIFIRNFI